MKLLGHVYVACEVFPERNQKLLALGAILPELVWYIENPAFSPDQLHEGGLRLYKYLKKNNKKWIDLALGVMTHSDKYGADKFNSLEHLRKIGFEKSDIPEIADALEIPTTLAKSRVHNVYSLAIDYYLAKYNPEIIDHIESTKEVDIERISIALSSCYGKSRNQVKKNIMQMWGKYDLKLVTSFKGLAILWQRLAKDLKEKDSVNIEKTANLVEKLYYKAKSHLPEFLFQAVKETRKNIFIGIKSLEKKNLLN